MNPNTIPNPETPTITITIPHHGTTTDGEHAYGYLAAPDAERLAKRILAQAHQARTDANA